MTRNTETKEDLEAQLYAPVLWDTASIFRPDDWIAYFDLTHEQIFDKRTPLGTRFRAYFAPVPQVSHDYRLVLFEIRGVFDPVRQVSYRGYVALLSANFPETIWGL